jgi:hypothetical protein
VIDEDRRRDPKRDQVRERVELHADFTLSLREARDAPVDAVEEQCEDDQQGCPVEVIAALPLGQD